MLSLRSAIVGSVVVLALAVMVGSASATVVVNVDFENDPTQSSSVTYSGQGAMAAPGNTWNSFNTGTAASVYYWGEITNQASNVTYDSGAFVDSQGGANSTRVSVTGITNIYKWTGYGAPAEACTTCTNLMYDWLINPSTSTLAWATIEGLTPNAQYNLVLYGHSHQGGGEELFSVGGVTQTTGLATGPHALTAGIDYVTYNNVTADASGWINVGFMDAGVNGAQGGFNGFQISSVPEPASCMLLTTGLIGLLAYAWRKRR